MSKNSQIVQIYKYIVWSFTTVLGNIHLILVAECGEVRNISSMTQKKILSPQDKKLPPLTAANEHTPIIVYFDKYILFAKAFSVVVSFEPQSS